MTGIVILPAGRDDAFEDYKQFIRDGHPIADIESYLNTSLSFERCRVDTIGPEIGGKDVLRGVYGIGRTGE